MNERRSSEKQLVYEVLLTGLRRSFLVRDGAKAPVHAIKDDEGRPVSQETIMEVEQELARLAEPPDSEQEDT